MIAFVVIGVIGATALSIALIVWQLSVFERTWKTELEELDELRKGGV